MYPYRSIFLGVVNKEETGMQGNIKEKAGLLMASLMCTIMLSPVCSMAQEVAAMTPVPVPGDWWKWPLILLGVTFVMGIIAVLGGVGGGVLYVPIMSGFFPFPY